MSRAGASILKEEKTIYAKVEEGHLIGRLYSDLSSYLGHLSIRGPHAMVCLLLHLV